jgi:cell division protease FtsH
MADKSKKPAPNKPKFSAWWIYTAIILVFLALNYFSSSSDYGNPKEILENQVLTYAKDGDVERIDISKSKQIAYIYLTAEAEKKEVHAKPADNGMSILSSDSGADY